MPADFLMRNNQQMTSILSAIQPTEHAWQRLQALNDSQAGAPSILHVGDVSSYKN